VVQDLPDAAAQLPLPDDEGNPVLHTSTHTDCAAIQEKGWTVDPLGGKVTRNTPYQKSPYDKGGGYIWGRGVSDDKGETAAMTFALQAIRELDVRLKGTLILTIDRMWQGENRKNQQIAHAVNASSVFLDIAGTNSVARRNRSSRPWISTEDKSAW